MCPWPRAVAVGGVASAGHSPPFSVTCAWAGPGCPEMACDVSVQTECGRWGTHRQCPPWGPTPLSAPLRWCPLCSRCRGWLTSCGVAPAGCTKDCAALGSRTYQSPILICPQPHSEPPGELAPQVSGRAPESGAAQGPRAVPGGEHGRGQCPPQLPGEASAAGGQGARCGLPTALAFPSSCGPCYGQVPLVRGGRSTAVCPGSSPSRSSVQQAGKQAPP